MRATSCMAVLALAACATSPPASLAALDPPGLPGFGGSFRGTLRILGDAGQRTVAMGLDVLPVADAPGEFTWRLRYIPSDQPCALSGFGQNCEANLQRIQCDLHRIQNLRKCGPLARPTSSDDGPDGVSFRRAKAFGSVEFLMPYAMFGLHAAPSSRCKSLDRTGW